MPVATAISTCAYLSRWCSRARQECVGETSCRTHCLLSPTRWCLGRTATSSLWHRHNSDSTFYSDTSVLSLHLISGVNTVRCRHCF